VSHPIRTAPAAHFRGLLRSFAFDPGLLTAHLLAVEPLARVVAEEVGKTRDRIFTPMVTLAAFIGQVLSDDHSCQAAVDRLIAWRSARGLPPCSADTGGYCKARRRLPETLLPRLARHAADRLGDAAPDGWLFHGRRVVLADGSSVSMPDTPANQRAYPQPRQQKAGCGFPVARVVVLIALATGCVLDAALCGGRGKLTGEHALLRGLHGRLRRGDILVADAYYSSYDEVMLLRQLGVDVVMRQTGGRRSDFRRGVRLGREDHTVEWHRSRNRRPWMTREEFAALPRAMTMRELRVRVGRPGFRTRSFVVVTTLLDAATFPGRELASLYRQRWHCELDIRSLKQALKMDVLRCKSPGLVRKEFWAHLLAANLIRGMMAEASRRHGLLPRQLSFQGARQMMEGFRVELNRVAPGEVAGLVGVMLRAIATLRIGDRPDRVEPRVVKRRPKAYPRMQEPRQAFKKRFEAAA
jgi:Transposase DDE domain